MELRRKVETGKPKRRASQTSTALSMTVFFLSVTALKHQENEMKFKGMSVNMFLSKALFIEVII